MPTLSSSLAPVGGAGSWPVMLTPFDEGRRIDWPAFDALVDWYLAAGSEGLFASCLSSELFELTASERLQLAAAAVARSGGRAPVIAAGAFGGGAGELADAVARLAATGVDAVILLTNQFAQAHEPDDAWLRAAEALLARADPGVALGLYECPLPYKRVLSPRLVAWAAQTGRFRFIKDTCCDLALIREKIAALSGSPLRFYNAHTATLLPSLQAGGHGFSGVGANAVPHLYAWLCRHFAAQPGLAARLQAFLIESSPCVDFRYPGSVKAYLRQQGLPVAPVCRVACDEPGAGELEKLRAFHASVGHWEKLLGLASPFPAPSAALPV